MAAEGMSCAACQEVTDEQRYAQLDDILAQYQEVPGALIPVLQMAQAIFGYLPDAALRRISTALGKSYSEVAGVVGFYSFFTTTPRGKHTVKFCLGTACYVSGAPLLLQKAEQELGIRVGSTTEDGQITLETCRCIGACSQSPAVTVDKDVYGRVQPNTLPQMLNKYRLK